MITVDKEFVRDASNRAAMPRRINRTIFRVVN
jgi:hypothetical protein